jgi:hypothetical protein
MELIPAVHSVLSTPQRFIYCQDKADEMLAHLMVMRISKTKLLKTHAV